MKIISLGMGVQSTAMYLMSSTGDLPRADHAIFADLGAESAETYEVLEKLLKWEKENNGIKIHVLKNNNLYEDLINNKEYDKNEKRFAGIPAFTNYTGGMINRQCTSKYKIEPVMKKIRKLHGLKKFQRMKETEVWLGISTDEIERAKISQFSKVEYIYPLIDKRLSRYNCLQVFKKFHFPIPPKSACFFCPYYSDKGWKHLKENDKKTWDKIIKVDNAIRNSLIDRNLKGELYLHRSLIPLERIEFADQQELFMCEEGFCGL